MKVFITGANGFIGSAVVKELLAAGHEVAGLARSDESAKAIIDAGAKVLKGDLEDLEALKQGALQADGIIHTAFVRNYEQFSIANNIDKAAIQAMGEAIEGTGKVMLVTTGMLGTPKTDGFVTEADALPELPRSSEATAIALAEKGINVSVVRLSPSVHDKGDRNFIHFMIRQAIKNGVAAYVGDGNNRWPAVHRLDAAHLFRLALEKGAKGQRYNAVADEGITIREIAEVIAEKMNLPLKPLLTEEEVTAHFEWLSWFVGFDSPATSYKTQEILGWKPTHIGLLDDMRENYF
ncbi:MAG: 3-beta hydroxysteroid dehydrogenase [Bacteroidia bacterium 44-10]|nr:MAG: 3-beta hydroxysteroid dehydrogenase [Bacteroidia bacterium 44-10]